MRQGDVDASLWIQGGALAALVITLVMLIRKTSSGDIVPRQTHERELAAANKIAEDWKKAFEKADARNDELQDQVAKLVTYAEAANRILLALPVPPQAKEAA